MNTYADNNKDNKTQPASPAIQKKDNGAVSLPLTDIQPSVTAQMQLQEIADNSPQVKQAIQLQVMADTHSALPVQKKGSGEGRQKKSESVQKKENNTGLPDNLKSGIENLSQYSMDDVKVHYNSDKPAQLQAHAYAQGSDIHVASGQEKYLPHEAWHVVQQKQGRVKPTLQMKGNINVNDDAGLEQEADVMGNVALQAYRQDATFQRQALYQNYNFSSIAQLEEIESAATITTNMAWGLIQSVLLKEMSDVRWTSVISPLLKAGDTLIVNKVSDWTGLATLVPGINLIITSTKIALGVWDTIPDNIKTGILYLIGVLTANAPILGRYDSLQGLIVKGDEGEVREKLQGWVDTAKTAVSYFTQPLSSLYRYLTGSSEEDVVSDPTTPEGTVPSKEETEKLINLNLQVITLMMNNLKLGYDSQEEEEATKTKEAPKIAAPKKNPGLIVEFFVQLHLFNHNLPERKGGGMDRLFFPFSGEFKYRAGSAIVINAADKTLLGNTLGSVSIFPLEVAKSGVKEAGLNIDKLIIGNGIVILTGAKGTIKNKLITLNTNAEVNIAGHSIGGSMNLQLNDGHFQSLALTNVNDEGNYKLKEFSVNNTYSGKTAIEIDKLDILKGTLSAENIKASAAVENKKLKSFEFGMNKFLLDFWGSNVDITGAHLSYIGADPEKEIEENILGGAKEIVANIHGVNINLKDLTANKKEGKYEFASGKVKFNNFEILVEKASLANGGIQITKATLSIPEYQIEGAVNSFSWNSNGLDFDSLSLALPGKTISPIDQVNLSNMSLVISKNGGYKVILTSDINVSPNGSSLLGATAAQLTLSKEEIAGTLKELKINTSMFEVLVKNAEFNKQRIGAEEAAISFKSRDEGEGYSNMLPSFDTGLLDFINPNIGLKAKDAYFNKGKGFSVGSVSPSIKAFTIKLFGIEATVNPEEQSITIKSSFTFPGSAPPIWPFSMSVPFPIFIGVAGHFGIELGGGVTLDFDVKAKRDKGKNKPYNFEAHPGIKGDLHLKISAGVELGARLAIALQANLYAQAGVNISTTTDLTGGLLYMDSKMTQSDPLKMLYALKSAITAEVGGELRVKAFMFYDKQLTRVKFKDWNLGEWAKSGHFGSLSDGTRSEDKEKGGFGTAITEPTMNHEILEGEEAKKLLLSANERIIGSGAKRKELISNLTLDVATLASQLLQKHQVIKREFDTSMNKLMEIILRKDAFFRKNYEKPDITVTALLTNFDRENELTEKQGKIRDQGELLDKYEAELKKILGFVNNVESGLDIVGLEEGVGNKKEQIDFQKEKTSSIQEGMGELTPPKIDLQNLNTELNQMGADALTVSVSSSIMTKAKFIEISTTTGLLGGENERKRVKVIDDLLGSYDAARKSDKSVQTPILQNLLRELRIYVTASFSSRTQAALLLQYQVEQALLQLK